MQSLSFRRAPVALLCAAALVLLAGCGKKKDLLPNAGNVVSGKITYKDGPLPFGLIQFYAAETEQVVGSSQVNPDGSYRIDNLPPGEVRIAILTKTPSMAGRGMPPPGMEIPTDPSQAPKSGPPPWHRRGPQMPGMTGRPGMPGGMSGGPGGPGGMTFPTVNSGQAPPEVRAEIEALDEKYRDPKTAKLDYTVTPGEQTHDIVLK